MKVLWLCNVVLPEIGDILGIKRNVFGGWLEGAWSIIDENTKGICVPILNPAYMKDGITDRCNYYSFRFISEGASELEKKELIERFKAILSDYNPDIIHIWGTEYVHSLCMATACKEMGLIEKVVINIQGILSKIAEVYSLGLPEELKDKDSIVKEKNDFLTRAGYEKELLKMVKYVSGRTDWDYNCIKTINSNLNYFHCNEMLRNEFYKNTQSWSLSECQRHSIFISQAGYAIKGLHSVLKQLKKVCMRYADCIIYIAGPKVYEIETDYGRFITEEINKCELTENIRCIGFLHVEEMIEMYKKANVYLSTSLIENSSNSICEAMYVGTPIVASRVGGTESLVEDKKSGFLYDLDETDKLEQAIALIFDNDNVCNNLSEEGKNCARLRHDKTTIKNAMLRMYTTLFEGNILYEC